MKHLPRFAERDTFSKYIRQIEEGQNIINCGSFFYIEIETEWYEINRKVKECQFPITNKEDKILKLLKKVDEIANT